MLTLHTYFRSSASYRVRIALELKSLTYESIPVHLVRGGGEQHLAAFAALNPLELVPVLGHDGHTITQSLAIIEYLEEIQPTPSLLSGDAASRARIRSIAQLIACDVHPLNNLRVLQRRESSVGVDKGARDHWYAHWVSKGFDALETMLASSAGAVDGRFCHGNTPTMADCCLIPQVYNAQRFSVSLAPCPTLQRINDACLQLQAFQRAAPDTQANAA